MARSLKVKPSDDCSSSKPDKLYYLISRNRLVEFFLCQAGDDYGRNAEEGKHDTGRYGSCQGKDPDPSLQGINAADDGYDAYKDKYKGDCK